MGCNLKVFYSDKLNSDQGKQELDGVIHSPSSKKPREVAQALKQFPFIEFVEPNPVTIDDFKLCHSDKYVDGVFNLTRQNGFGTISPSVNLSLPYTTGAMYDAAIAAKPDSPTAALVSGFHHAGYNGWEEFGYFCTFNGLMVTALKLNKLGLRTSILDCDMHQGNGTKDIIHKLGVGSGAQSLINHHSLGYHCYTPDDSTRYFELLDIIFYRWGQIKPDVILYQAGTDVHVDDPYGGILTTEQMFQRDKLVFSAAQHQGIPIAFNLAGGYQVGPNGEIDKIVNLHLNTFRAAQEVYNL